MEPGQIINERNQFVEYDDEEIHSMLLALLEIWKIAPYKSRLCTYNQYSGINSNPMSKFSRTTNRNSEGEEEAREVNCAIFRHNLKIFVNIYPTTLRQIINEKVFDDFEEKLNEATFELDNFSNEFNLDSTTETCFTFPLNKGNYHWVLGSLQLIENRKLIARINDPFGQRSGINDEEYKDIRDVLSRKFENYVISFISETNPNVQRDVYCGGAVRRMRDGLIFNNNPYEWERIDNKVYGISSNFYNSLNERRADLDLLLTSLNPQAKKTGSKLLAKYNDLNNLINTGRDDQRVVQIFMKYNKFIKIENEVLENYYNIDDVENLIISSIFKKFNQKLDKFSSMTVCDIQQTKQEWLDFIFSFDKKKIYENFINKINEEMFPLPPQTFFSHLGLSSLESSQQISAPKIYYSSQRSESSSKASQYKEQQLLLEHFLPDSDQCIFFPEKRFLNKMRLRKNQICTLIEKTVQKLKMQYNKQMEKKKLLLTTHDNGFNTIVGAVIIEFKTEKTKIFPIKKSKENHPQNANKDEEIMCQMILENYDNKHLLALKTLRSLMIIDYSEELLKNVKEIESSLTKPTAAVMSEIENLKKYIQNTKNLEEFMKYSLNFWEEEELSERAEIVNHIKNKCKTDPILQKRFENLAKEKKNYELVSEHRKEFQTFYFNEGKLNKAKLEKHVKMIRGHSESELINRIEIPQDQLYDPNEVK